MKVEILGGGNEVGASCLLCEIDSHHILVDCGIRMGDRSETGAPSDSLPDLSRLSDIDRLVAILVTHAHMDHTGALPLVHQAFPKTPIYATAPTVHLMQVLLVDALKIMSIKAEQEAEIPLYDPNTLSQMFTKIVPVDFGEKSITISPKLTVDLHPAGHILGASIITIRGSEGSILISGDISKSDQRTIAGMRLPKIRPDILITESTYGNRLHANRDAEEKRLVSTVNSTLERGGKILIPAFALGRSQEVLLILQNFVNQGMIPSTPIWVDGLVRSICEVYSDFPDYLMPALRRRIENSGNPFFYERGHIRAVTRPSQREKILNSGPCIIVASSGMLSGGPSQYYAFHLASNPNNSILLTGYQDEESPGRKILAIAEGGGGYLSYEGDNVEINCEVGKYGLSAHADAAEIAAMIKSLNPGKVILVHGDMDARSRLSEMVAGSNVVMPENGEIISSRPRSQTTQTGLNQHISRSTEANTGQTYDSNTSRSIKKNKTIDGVTDSSILDSSNALRVLWEKISNRIRNAKMNSRAYSTAELASTLLGSDYNSDDIQRLKLLLESDQIYFSSDWKRPYLYRARPSASVAIDKQRRQTMERISPYIKGKLIIAKTKNNFQPAICLSTSELGFQAIKVGKSSTEHSAEDLHSIITEWELNEPFDVGKEKTKLNILLRQTRPILRLLKPEVITKLILKCSIDPDTKEPGCTVKQLVDALESSDSSDFDQLSRLHKVSADSRVLPLAIAWRVSLHHVLFETTIDERGETHYRLVKIDSIDTLSKCHLTSETTGINELTKISGTTDTNDSVVEDADTIAVDESKIDNSNENHYLNNQDHSETDQYDVDHEDETDQLDQSPMEQNQALATIDQLFSVDSGLYKKGANISNNTLLLSFNFPGVAKKEFSKEIELLEKITGWSVKINGNPNQEALRQQALGLLPSDVLVIKGPSIRITENSLELRLKNSSHDNDTNRDCSERYTTQDNDSINRYQQLVDQFYKKTGFTFAISFDSGVTVTSRKETSLSKPIDQLTKNLDDTNNPNSHESDLFRPEKNVVPMEINSAYRLIKDSFGYMNVDIYKTGKKHNTILGEDYIEVSFVSPHIGKRNTETLRELANETGWSISYSKNPNQHAIADFIRRLIPLELGASPSPSFYPTEDRWILKVVRLPNDSDLESIKKRFSDFCGYDLELIT